MSPNSSIKVVAVIAALFLFSISYGQAKYDGDNLISFLGKGSDSPELKDLESTYKLEMANEAHYFSKEGIELILKGGVLNEINLFKNSAVNGSYKAGLPKGLSFGMASGAVKAKLGKPSTSYNTGYCEFELANCLISCWFEGGGLSQLEISAK